jgi:uncharacterized iron-regulated protein
MRVVYYRLGIILSLALSWPCAAYAAPHAAQPSVSVGRIWDAAARRFISSDALYRRLREADFVLLGETHSNPQHHRLQARVIEQMVAQGRRPAVVFEMFERDQQATIERVRERYPDDAARIARETHMTTRGWPSRLYQPLISTVLAHDLPLIAADLPQAGTRAIVAEGLPALGAERIAAWGLAAPLPAPGLEMMRADIVDAHCGHAPENLIDGMVAAQRARDAALADGLIEHVHPDGAVLIAGRGHVRGDLAAPIYLHRRAPDKVVVSVAFTEADAEPPHDRPPTSSSSAIYDYLWFTRGRSVQDPCERFKKKLQSLSASPPAGGATH